MVGGKSWLVYKPLPSVGSQPTKVEKEQLLEIVLGALTAISISRGVPFKIVSIFWKT